MNNVKSALPAVAGSGETPPRAFFGLAPRRLLMVLGITIALLAGTTALPSNSNLPVLSAIAPTQAHAGNTEWWGYRTNSFETWALATQSPDYIRTRTPLLQYFSVATYVMATSWRFNAQSARRMGMCTGITWSATPIFVGCSSR